MRSLAVLALLSVATASLTFGSLNAVAADQCSSKVVIFSSNSNGGGGVNPHAFVCLTGGVQGVDTARITPGSDRVNVRYVGDLGEAVPTLTARLVGLGADATVTLTRNVDPTVGVTYNQAGHTPIDPLATGPITATVFRGTTQLDSVTFRTYV